MDFRIYQNQLSRLSARFNLMVSLVFGLLIANIILASLVWVVSQHRQIEVTPFFGGEGYQKSATSLDARYLSLMSQNFIYARLNVTPETVSSNYKRFLSFVDGKAYPDIMKRLDEEAKLIQTKKISSHFVITDIQLNLNALTAEVKGVLERHVGLRALPSETLTYHLSYRYRLGRFTLLSFTQQESSHA